MITGMGIRVRRAMPADASALVRLRAVMYAGMGQTVAEGGRWRVDAEAWFDRFLRQPDRFAAFVAEADTAVVSAAAGLVIDHPPSPANPGSVRGYVFNVATEVAFRRRGLGNACLIGLLDWFAADTAVQVIDLTATGDGNGMYRAQGFEETGYPALRLSMNR